MSALAEEHKNGGHCSNPCSEHRRTTFYVEYGLHEQKFRKYYLPNDILKLLYTVQLPLW